MLKHTLKLLALLMIFSVAPAAAGHQSETAGAQQDDSGCPYERARLAAAAAQSDQAVTVTFSAPEGSFFDPARRSAFLP